ncbi:non-ribosomal peptide synthetase [Acanthopleuribacter pedis]|uniref:Amino acid adenylation domain-containing protein n=1 Tax=Acanthopleuribacter pedis TaxID=442870 RepID=A0A8J7Q1E8_9BACT|nr:non-ribosomal peptide synthetase [Acanthopleuribacter pedis]MBO1317345.1 amino acid adenylation domain-containing protein [Acanthopleuribacter pedis]MBO1318652.1 amino acid adenylation domain-containing protein [Acanthopleuribacter pedis]
MIDFTQNDDDLALLDLLLADELPDPVMETATLAPRDPAAPTPLSFAQNRLWVLHRLDPDSTVYNVCTALRLRGDLNRDALGAALDEIVRRHEVLRTCFREVDGQVVAEVKPAAPVALPLVDLRDATSDTEAARHAEAMRSLRFDLERGPLLQFRLLHTGTDEWVMLFTLHHLVCDGWSLGLFARELASLYNAFVAGEPSPLPELGLQYGDFSVWQRATLVGERYAEHTAFWRKTLGDSRDLDLPTDRPRPPHPSHRGAVLRATVPETVTRGLESLAQENEATLFMVLAAAYGLVLGRVARQDDLVIGTPVAGRNRPELETLIGFFINTVPLRFQMKGSRRFSNLLARFRDQTLDAFGHQDLPFEQIVTELAPQRDPARHPFFQVAFALHNAPEAEEHLNGLSLEPLRTAVTTAKFDLTLALERADDGLVGSFEYSTDLFDATTVTMLSDAVNTVLAQLAAGVDALDRLTLINPNHGAMQNEIWNATSRPYPRDSNIATLFDAAAAAHPNQTALVCGDTRMSYAELADRANRLAAHLIERGVRPDQPVGLFCGRAPAMVVGMLAVLKAGGAYVPLDPGYPLERLKLLLEETGAEPVLYDQTAPPAQAVAAERLVAINAPHETAADPVTVPVSPNSLAYIVFTSGSTGRPKGVAVDQRAVVRLVRNTDYTDLTPQTVFLHLSASAFDATTLEIWGPLLNGGTVVLMKPAPFSLEEVAATARAHAVTHLFLTTGLFKQLVDQPVGDLPALRALMTGGEAVSAGHMTRFMQRYPFCHLTHVYGPTENTTFSTFEAMAAERRASVIPIGRPIANSTCLVLDDHGNLLPPGAVGELCVGGDGLARGYWRRPDLTAARFVPHPFSTTLGERLYRTGDLVRQQADGRVVFVGRVDDQVKIRGFRVEPGEVQAALRDHAPLQDVLVAARRNPAGHLRLCAWLVWQPGEAQDLDAVRTFLNAHLPEYMHPGYLVVLPQFPLNANGKVDRNALPDPFAQTETGTAYAAPRNQREQWLADALAELLGVARVGRHDAYFEMGGDSIIAIQLVGRMRRHGLRLNVADLFANPSVAALAPLLTAQADQTETGPVQGTVPLTPIQQWFFQHQDRDHHHFNQSVLLRGKPRFDTALLQQALDALWCRHDALRLTFTVRDSAVQQAYADLAPPHLKLVDPAEHADPAAAMAEHGEKASAAFDLGAGPLWNPVLYRLPDGDRLWLAAHHLIVDGVSWRILLEDLTTAYGQAERGQATDLGPKTASFQTWSEALVRRAADSDLHAERTYWETTAAATAAPPPTTKVAGDNRVGDSALAGVSLSPERTADLLGPSHKAFHTEINDLLLTALARALHGRLGEHRTRITLESHGRETLPNGPPVDRTIGWFTTMFPFLLELAEGDLATQIKTVKEHLRAVPHKGGGYGVLRYLATEETAATMTPAEKPWLAFNYLGVFDTPGEDGPLADADEQVGRDMGVGLRRGNDLEVGGLVVNGKLKLTLTYDRGRYEAEAMTALLTALRDELALLVRFCCAREQAEKTPSDFLACDLDLPAYQNLLTQNALNAADIEDIVPLAPMQQGLLFESLVDNRSDAYFLQMSYRIEGPFPLDAFRHAWHQLCDHHAVLRTAFLHRQVTTPRQVVFKKRDPEFHVRDWRGLENQASELNAFYEKDRRRGFDLERDPLLRFTIIRLDEQTHQVVWRFHHIVLDGWCMGRLFDQCGLLMDAAASGTEATLPEVPPYRDYLAWLTRWDKAAACAWWTRHLAGHDQRTGMNALGRPEPDAGYDLGEFTLDLAPLHAVRAMAAAQSATTAVMCQALWAFLLARFNDRDDVCFGAVVSGRPPHLDGADQMIGLFINAVPVRVQVHRDETFADLVGRVQRDALAAEPYHYLPLAELQVLSPLGRDTFDHLLIFENYPPAQQVKDNSDPLTVSDLQVHDHTHYDFNLIFIPGEKLQLRITFNRKRFDEDRLRAVAEHYRVALNAVLAEPQHPLITLDGAPAQTEPIETTVAERNTNVLDLWDARVAKNPQSPVLSHNGTTIGAAELDRAAERMARFLVAEHGIQPEDRVGVLLNRAPHLMTAILAVLKAGAAFVPMEPTNPDQRLHLITAEAGCRLVLSEPGLRERLPETPCMDVTHGLPERDAALPRVDGHALAYVLFTSGSTGKPKGCAMSHANLHHYLTHAAALYFAEGGGCFGLYSSIAFDLTLSSLFLPLLRGERLHLFDAKQPLNDILTETLSGAHGIDSVKLTPSHIALLDHLPIQSSPVKRAIVGGEALLNRHVATLRRLNPRMAIFNEYGPTEATVGCVIKSIGAEDEEITIGNAMPDMSTHVLDRWQRPTLFDMPGELYLGGKGLARGYWGRADLTAERFIPHAGGTRLYKTGDWVRRRDDGELLYLGRRDDQVKVRGYRIELGEIQARLTALANVRQAHVACLQDPQLGPSLVAWVVPAHAGDSLQGLRDQLGKTLPDYMVPAHLIPLAALPLTVNGKVDSAALPGITATERPFEAPVDALEQDITTLWSEVLGVERVGRNDDFFALGGHSLVAMQVLAQIHRRRQVQVPLRAFFEKPTPARLAELVHTTEKSEYIGIEPVAPQEDYVLSHAQKRLWSLQMMGGAGATTAYNMPKAFVFERGLNADALKKALTDMVHRHEALRTGFIVVDGEPRQKIAPPSVFNIREVDLREAEDGEAAARAYCEKDAHQPFDLASPPLLRVALLYLAEGRAVLLLNINHVIGDGWSMNVIYREILSRYQAHDHGVPAPINPPRIQYKDFAVWQSRQTFKKEKAYWLEQLADPPPPLQLPTDFAPTLDAAFRGDTVYHRVEAEVLAGLHRLANRKHTTVSNVVLAVLNLFLYKLTGRDDLSVGMALANRGHADLQNLIGFFVNLLPIRTRFTAGMEFEQLLESVIETVNGAFDHQNYPLDLLVADLNPERDGNRQTLFNVIYGFQSFADLRLDVAMVGKVTDADGAGTTVLREAREIPLRFHTTKFDLTLYVLEEGGQLHFTMEYDTALFKPSTIKRYLTALARIAEAVVREPHTEKH